MTLHADILDLFRVGQLGPMRLGMTDLEAKAWLGDPDDWGLPGRKPKNPLILKYGQVEFHFTRWRRSPLRLSLINFEPEGTLSAGARLKVDWWIIREGLPLAEFEQGAEKLGIACCRIKSVSKNETWLQVGVGVKVQFTAETGLATVSLSG